MIEKIFIPDSVSKEEKYAALIPQLKSLTLNEPDMIANISNIIAALTDAFNFLWVGVYKVGPSLNGIGKELVLGPYQGPLACTRIGYGKGVCGAAWKQREIILVPDVNNFPGHIACSSFSRSEIVLPVFHDGEVTMVLDIDSEHLAAFDETDKKYLQQIVVLIEEKLNVDA